MRKCQLVALWTIFLTAAGTAWFLMATAWYADDEMSLALRELHFWLFVALAMVAWFYWWRFSRGREQASLLSLLVIPNSALLLVVVYAALWGLHLPRRLESVLMTWRAFCSDAPWFALKMAAVSLLITFPAIDAGAIIALRWRRRPPQTEDQLFARWVVLLVAQLVIGLFLHLGGAAAISRLGGWAGFRIVRPDLRRHVAEAAASGKYQLCRTTSAPLNRMVHVDGLTYFASTRARASAIHVGPPAACPQPLDNRVHISLERAESRPDAGWYERGHFPGLEIGMTSSGRGEMGWWLLNWLCGARDDPPELSN